MKCANCKHEESDHENVTLKRLGKRDVEMKPCLHIQRGTVGGRIAGVNAVCDCRDYVAPGDMEKFVERRFKESVISAIEEVHPEIIGYSVPHDAADLAWRKYTGDTE